MDRPISPSQDSFFGHQVLSPTYFWKYLRAPYDILVHSLIWDPPACADAADVTHVLFSAVRCIPLDHHKLSAAPTFHSGLSQNPELAFAAKCAKSQAVEPNPGRTAYCDHDR